MKSQTILQIQSTIQCKRCDRVFDLLNDADAHEWDNKHNCEASQWIKENVCATCGMVITNRWDSHRIYKECEKELSKKEETNATL